MDLTDIPLDELRTFVNVTAPNDLAVMKPGIGRDFVEELQLAGAAELRRRFHEGD